MREDNVKHLRDWTAANNAKLAGKTPTVQKAKTPAAKPTEQFALGKNNTIQQKNPTSGMSKADWSALAAAVAKGGADYLTKMNDADNEAKARAAAVPDGLPAAGAKGSAAQIKQSQDATPTQTSCIVAYNASAQSLADRTKESKSMPPAGFKWVDESAVDGGPELMPTTQAQLDIINKNGWGM